jgi:hypothetical protein
MRLALSSNGSTRPANSAWGPSGPENQRSNSLRFFPAGFSRIPRRISATVIEEMNRSSSALFRHPRDQVFRWHWFDDIADDIGVEEAPAHRSTLRPRVTGRLRSRSAPTKGDRRNASRIPPFFGGSVEMVRRTAARIRAESGSLPASRFASDRIKSRSPSSPRTSNRAIPRCLRRFR